MMEKETAIAKAEQPAALARPADEMSVEQLVDRVRKVQEVQRDVMKDGTHYGKIPGVDKPTLLKPGAEVLGMVFRLDPQFEITEQIRDGDHVTFVIRCTLYHVPTGARLGSGMGSCSTKESRYAYRKGERSCPKCGSMAIIKGKAEYGGGWVCFAKKGGCGAKFGDKDQAIVGQVVGRMPNPDLYDQHNTVLKMAIKRAHVAAILFVTCASEIFTQDVEDMPRDNFPVEEEPAPEPRKVDTSYADECVKRFDACKTVKEVEELRTEVGKNRKRLNGQADRVARARDEALTRVAADADFDEAIG